MVKHPDTQWLQTAATRSVTCVGMADLGRPQLDGLHPAGSLQVCSPGLCVLDPEKVFSWKNSNCETQDGKPSHASTFQASASSLLLTKSHGCTPTWGQMSTFWGGERIKSSRAVHWTVTCMVLISGVDCFYCGVLYFCIMLSYT